MGCNVKERLNSNLSMIKFLVTSITKFLNTVLAGNNKKQIFFFFSVPYLSNSSSNFAPKRKDKDKITWAGSRLNLPHIWVRQIGARSLRCSLVINKEINSPNINSERYDPVLRITSGWKGVILFLLPLITVASLHLTLASVNALLASRRGVGFSGFSTTQSFLWCRQLFLFLEAKKSLKTAIASDAELPFFSWARLLSQQMPKSCSSVVAWVSCSPHYLLVHHEKNVLGSWRNVDMFPRK